MRHLITKLAIFCAAVFVPLAFSVSSCTVTDVGNPPTSSTDVTVGFDGYDGERADALTLENGVTIESAWVALGGIDMQRSTACTDDGTNLFDRPVVADLIAGESFPPDVSFRAPSGVYCRMQLRLTPLSADALPENAPDELAGYSVLVRGHTEEGTDFEIAADLEPDMLLRGRGGTFDVDGRRLSLIVAFALDGWIEGGSIDDAAAGEDEVLVSPTSNAGLYDDFEETFFDTASLVVDVDADSELDIEELESDLARSSRADEDDDDDDDDDDAGTDDDDAGTDVDAG